ncbi:MAG: phosphatase PAP2 family protein [Acidimicrobiales bacterium]
MTTKSRPAHSRATHSSRDVWARLAGALGRGIAVVVALGIVLAILGLAVVGRHGGGAIQGWDNTVEAWFLHHRAHLVTVSKVIAKLGDAPLLGAISVAITIILLAARQRMRALIPLAAYLGGEFLVFVTRLYIHRPRPVTANYPAPGAIPGVHETSYSFPSGHATAAAAVVVGLAGLAVITWRTWLPWILGVLVALAIAASRLVLGVHWFSDVAFGLAVGIPWGVAVTVILADLPWPLRWGRPAAVAVPRRPGTAAVVDRGKTWETPD